MANTLVMEQHFERDKNLKASGITIVVCTCLFLLFFFVRWTNPVPPKPDPVIEGIEVNLGTSDVGSGDEQPMVQGEPGPTNNPDNNPQQSSGQPPSGGEDNPEKDPDGTSSTSKTNTKVTNPNPAPTKKVEPTPPAPPKPKTVMPKYGGGDGRGDGNTKESYNKPGSEGNDKNGKGDKGQKDGNPDGKVYTGPGGTGNIQIKGDRKMMYYPSRAADVEPGVVTVSVVVTPGGTGTFQAFLKGKFLAAYKTEIISYLKGVSFNKADHESTIEMTFNFKR